MSQHISEACRRDAEATVRNFNARWNINLLHVKTSPSQFLFTRDELTPLEAVPAWRSASEVFAAARGTSPTAADLIAAGRQLGVLYTRAYHGPGPRSFYWIAPHGVEPTASDQNRLAAAKLTHVVPDR